MWRNSDSNAPKCMGLLKHKCINKHVAVLHYCMYINMHLSLTFLSLRELSKQNTACIKYLWQVEELDPLYTNPNRHRKLIDCHNKDSFIMLRETHISVISLQACCMHI